MTTITHPADALALLHKEFPTATMTLLRDSGGRLYGYEFKAGRCKHFAQLEQGGGVDYQRLRLFYDCTVYARNAAAKKRAEKAERAAAKNFVIPY